MELTELQKLEQGYKETHGMIAKVENVDTEGKTHTCYFKSPSRLTLGYALGQLDTNPIEACEYIFNDAAIKEISDVDYFLNNNGVFIGIMAALQSLAKVKKSTFTTF